VRTNCPDLRSYTKATKGRNQRYSKNCIRHPRTPYATTSAPAGAVRPAEDLRWRRWSIWVGPRDSRTILRLLSGPLYGRLQLGYARRQARDEAPVLTVGIALLVKLLA
jgi:hypothetical protein